MKKLLILGSGAGGVMCATKLRPKLDEKEWKITVIDRNLQHHYQAGWLFVPFDIYDIKDCIKPQMDFVPKGTGARSDPGRRRSPRSCCSRACE